MCLLTNEDPNLSKANHLQDSEQVMSLHCNLLWNKHSKPSSFAEPLPKQPTPFTRTENPVLLQQQHLIVFILDIRFSCSRFVRSMRIACHAPWTAIKNTANIRILQIAKECGTIDNQFLPSTNTVREIWTRDI
jgi:hypothetical protein